MKDAYELLYQKEADLVRVRQEIESLKIAASLLADNLSSDDQHPGPDGLDKKPAEKAPSLSSDSNATGTEGPFSIARPGFWNTLLSRRR